MERADNHPGTVAAASGKRANRRDLQLIVSTVGRSIWCLPSDSLRVLVYHRVLPAGHPDWGTMLPGMVVSARNFELQLSALKEHFTLIHLSDWIRRVRAGRPVPPRACAITFDDGWSDNFETAYPILRRHHAPATMFLVSDYVNTQRRFWPERLSEVLQRAQRSPGNWFSETFGWLRELGLGPGLRRDTIIAAAKLLPDSEIHDHVDAMEQALAVERPTRPHLMSWPQARTMVHDGLIEIGSHTRTHCRLGRPPDGEALAREIVGSKDLLEEELGRTIDLFCYPNGEISAAADKLVRRHYLAACSSDRGWNPAGHDPHRLRRIGVHDGVSGNYHAFLARVSDSV